MGNSLKKQHYEKSIFMQFLSFSPLVNQIVHNSVQNCEPPEPDIVCQTKNKKSVYFELVKIIHPELAKGLSDTINFPKACKVAISKLSQEEQTTFNSKYSNVLVFFRFRKTSSKNITRLLPQIIKYLMTIEDNYEGILTPVEFDSIISEIKIKRYNYRIQSFRRNSAGSYGDMALAQIQSKFDKKYICNSAISLLFYYDIQEAFSCSVEESKTIINNIDLFISEHISSSRFSKVWGFDVRNQKIVYEFPS